MSKADTWINRVKPVYLVFIVIAIYTIYFSYFTILKHYTFQTHLAVIMAVALETFAAISMLILMVGIHLFRRRKKISLLYLVAILAIAVSIATLYAGASFVPPLSEGYY
ncbi:MAG: hypothetical protein ACE5OW_04060 [Candidatus Bathyarchaeia archaeon]